MMRPLVQHLSLVLMVAVPFLGVMLYLYYNEIVYKRGYPKGCHPTRIMGLFYKTSPKSSSSPIFLCTAALIENNTIIVPAACWKKNETESLVVTSGTLMFLTDANFHNVTAIKPYQPDVIALDFTPPVPECILKETPKVATGGNSNPKKQRLVIGWSEKCKTKACTIDSEVVDSSAKEYCSGRPGALILDTNDVLVGLEPKDCKANNTIIPINNGPVVTKGRPPEKWIADYMNYKGLVENTQRLQDAISKNLLVSDKTILSARVLAINASTGSLVNCAWWQRQGLDMGGPRKLTDVGMEPGHRPKTDFPWYEDADSSPTLRSPKFVESPPNIAYKGWWTYPYYSCQARRWLISYSVPIPPPGRRGLKGFLSLDVDVSHLEINQCEHGIGRRSGNEIIVFHGSHKCHNVTTQCVYRSSLNAVPWNRGRYQCVCRAGYYSEYHHGIFNGTLIEVAWAEYLENISDSWSTIFRCKKCAPGCHNCRDSSPCLATYHWPFRITLLVFSIMCVICTIALNIYMFKHRKLKVFKVASPIFLCITLCGCATMYLEMAAIFPILDKYSCIATKWSRHLGFCVTYTALLMKTWRVSLTYRVKSAHKVKLTDKQLLQWMVPILLVMLIYLGTWTLSNTPDAEEIVDNEGLKFKQCVYDWWDHSLAIGEVLFLAWGIRVCYNVRNAESLYNEARLISYAIYNIAIVNIMMIAFHLFIFPRAGPDIKYLLGFIRTQLSTSTTIALVFGPKIIRVLKGQGDQWDNRARSRGVTTSFSLNGIGLVPEEAPDLYQENEELKEEVQKLAAQIEFMKIVHMEINNRHVKPKTGGYFSSLNAPSVVQSPLAKQGCILGQSKPPEDL